MNRPLSKIRPIGPFVNSSKYSSTTDEMLVGDIYDETFSQIDFVFSENLRESEVSRYEIANIIHRVVGGFYDVEWIANPVFDNSTYILVGISSASKTISVLSMIKEETNSRIKSVDGDIELISVKSTCTE
jgi:hypothetical protein